MSNGLSEPIVFTVVLLGRPHHPPDAFQAGEWGRKTFPSEPLAIEFAHLMLRPGRHHQARVYRGRPSEPLEHCVQAFESAAWRRSGLSDDQ